ncbi:MAG: hypothetical protein JRH20_11440 [Deltaproteobacteria bacterium]|nr:hypothetical protein [Deltaproteobacteria bacterium]
MDPVCLGIGAIAGVIIGIIINIAMSKGKIAELEKLPPLLEEAKKAESAVAKQLGSRDKELKEAGAKAKKAADVLKTAEKRAEEAQGKLKAAEQTRDKATQEATEHQAARQQAEGRAKQAEKLASEASGRGESLASELEEAQKQASEASEVAERRNDEITRLRASLEGAREGSASGLEGSVEIFADAGNSLDKILTLLLEHESQSAAVLADSNGIVVAAAGEGDLRDGVAATAQLLTRLGKQFEGMVPFDMVKSFDLRDNTAQVIAGRAFVVSGEPLSLATYGKHPPASRVLDGAMASVVAALD